MKAPFRYLGAGVIVPIIAALAVVVVCYVLYLRESSQVEKNLLDREAIRLNVFDRLVQRDFQSVTSDLIVLADGEGLRAYLKTGLKDDYDHAVHRAVFFSKEEVDYDQIRFIDEKGQEIIRVNQGGVVVPGEQLQNKADRPYFQKTAALLPGQVYVSALDLNIEHGRIEQPFRPTIRFAAPIVDETGRRRGIYIINYNAQKLIMRLQDFVPIYKNRLRILNDRGYWIKAAQDEQEWGFMFPEKAGMTLAQSDSGVWKMIEDKPAGQVPFHGGYFSWERISMRQAAAQPLITIMSESDYMVMGSEVTPQEWNALFANMKQGFVVIAVILVFLIWVIWWIFQLRRRAQQDLDRVFMLSRDLLCVAGFDGYFKKVNPAWETTLGYTAEELTSRPYLEFVHPDDRDKTQTVAVRQEGGYEVLSFENRYRCKDGSYRWLSWSARPLVDEKLIFGSARDLTDRKSSEEEVLKLNEKLQLRAEQLEAANKELESFSYSVSHDLRAPLRHIHGFVEILQKSPSVQGEEKSLRYMSIIATAARDMGRLIDDLLDFSRTGRAEMHPIPVDMRQMVDQTIRGLDADAKGRQIDWVIKPLPKVACDPGLLHLVWVNLLSNALKYSRPREKTRIEIGTLDDDDPKVKPGEVVFYVRDNGVGFDMQYVAKLFGVFQRLHRSEDFEGTGIGLANVQRIIHRHGGRAWAVGEVDVGATIYFSLPVSEPQPVKSHVQD